MFVRSLPALAILAAAVVASVPAAALDAPKPALRLTVYANGMALVDEARTVQPSGSDVVRLDKVGPMMIADSVRVDLGSGTEVREIALDSDVLTEATLLQRSLGKTIRVVSTNPATGDETMEEAEVLSVAGGLVLRIRDRIETRPLGRLVFDSVPDDLHATPTLTLRLAKPLTAPVDGRLTYLTDGLSWEAVYTAVFSPAHDSLDLQGWAKIVNNAGVDFDNAAVSLVAGEVRRDQQRPQGKILMRAEAMAVSDSVASMAPRSELSAFHLYALPGPVTLRDKETKQRQLLSADGVVSRRILEFRSGAPVFGPLRGGTEPQAVLQKVELHNDAASHLGVPLPAGLLRAYVRDTDGALRFIGEDRIDNTALGGDVALNLGRAFDVTVARTQTAFRQVGDRTTETAFALHIQNGGEKPASVRVFEDIPGDWEILEQSQSHRRDGVAARWEIKVPANGAVDLTYQVRVRR